MQPKSNLFLTLSIITIIILVFALLGWANAESPSKHILITDTKNHRVIEVDVKSRKITWQYGTTGKAGKGFNRLYFPLQADRLANKNTLIVEADNGKVIEISPKGKIIWEINNSHIRGPFYPLDAQRLDNGNTLITNWAGQEVIEVDINKTIVWRYGNGIKNEIGRLNYPTAASRLENGNTLITDTQNFRIIEVDGAKNIVWRYGAAAGRDRGLLYFPVKAARLANGNTLVVDRETSRVIEVDPDKNIVWRYGGTKGSGQNQLNDPTDAARLRNGLTLITDHTNHRVIMVTPQGEIVWRYGSDYTPGKNPGELFFPGSAQEVPPALALADVKFDRKTIPFSISSVVAALPVLILILSSIGLLFVIIKRES